MKKRRVRIVENSWLARMAARRLQSSQVAMVIGHTIYLHNTTVERFFARPSWVLHELKHVEQYERLGLVRFLWRYIWDYRKYGYYNSPLEVEARAAEGAIALPDTYDLSAYDRFR